MGSSVTAALSAITAAVVGVIVCLAGWFALHTLFAATTESRFLGLNLTLPAWSTFDWRAAVASTIALILAFPLRAPLWAILGVTVVAGALLKWLIT